jgi:hypothetical protein
MVNLSIVRSNLHYNSNTSSSSYRSLRKESRLINHLRINGVIFLGLPLYFFVESSLRTVLKQSKLTLSH